METETQAAFARRLGKDRSHVTRLKQAGRLVMEGKRVVVNASLTRLEATESPLPRDIANRDRLAAERGDQGAREANNADALDVKGELETVGLEMKRNQAAKLAAEAEISQMERDKMAGRLCVVDEVRAAGLRIGSTIQSTFESLPDRYAAELAAATDTSQAHAMLVEAVELALRTCSKTIADELGKVGADE